MRSFILAVALQASLILASPLSPFSSLLARQAEPTMPANCTNYCSIDAGCACIKRPSNCVANYTVQAADTCDTITNLLKNVDATDLYAWNPEIGQSCFGLQAYVPVCVNIQGYEYPGPVVDGSIVDVSAIPVPVMPTITKNCTTYQYVGQTGKPSFADVLQQNNLTNVQFNEMNFPSQNATEGYGTWAGYWSCVKASS